MKIPGLTDATIREHTTEESYRRGDDYFQDGAVLHLETNAPGLVEAHVQGSQHLPYTIHVRHDDAGITDVACTCPFFAGSTTQPIRFSRMERYITEVSWSSAKMIFFALSSIGNSLCSRNAPGRVMNPALGKAMLRMPQIPHQPKPAEPAFSAKSPSAGQAPCPPRRFLLQVSPC